MIESNGLLKSKIIGGFNVFPNTIKYMASLRHESGEHFCGGGIISPYHVLSAAHCLILLFTTEEPKFRGAYVVVGSVSINSGGSKHHIKATDYPLSFLKSLWIRGTRKLVIRILINKVSLFCEL